MKFFKYIAKFVFLFLFFGSAFADVPYIPPTSPQAIVSQAAHLTPVEAWQVRNGVDLKNRSIDLNKFHAQYGSAQSKNGTVTGAKSHPATFVDNHGATARGSFKTTTVMPGNNTLANLAGGLMGAGLMGEVVNGYNSNGVADALRSGNYTYAYAKMAESNAHALGRYGDAMSGGLGTGIYNFLNDLLLEKNNQFLTRVQSDAEALAASYNPDIDSIAIFYYNHDNYHQYVHGKSVVLHIFPNLPWLGIKGNGAGQYAIASGNQLLTDWLPNPPQMVRMFAVKNDPMYYTSPSFDINQAVPTEAEIVQALQALLASNQQNTQLLTDIVNLLAANGKLNETNTTTTVDNGGTAQTTFLTAPYTPQGSTQAQQTSFTIHPDGSVTATTIPRPDLAANTSQAPTRAPVGQTATAPATTAPKETATPEAPDICANNPNSLMCAGIGSVDYSDPVLPETSIDISLNPLNVFASGGVCPQPVGFDLLGSRQEFRYDSMCDVAQKARPWIIILSMLFSFTLVYYALGLGKK